MKDPAYILFREVVIILTCLLVIEGMNFYGLLSFVVFDIEGSLYCVMLALVTWALVGIAFILKAQSQIRQWVEYEKLSQDY